MTAARLNAKRRAVLERLLPAPLRIGDVELKIRRSLVGLGWAKLQCEAGFGWLIEITEAGRAALDTPEEPL